MCRCAFCPNDARYIDETGAYTCALCPLKMNRDSIRLQDVPALLAWARSIGERTPLCTTSLTPADTSSLRAIIGRKPT